MIVTFISNYLTHHQIPFCDEISRRTDVEFHFISTEPMEQERIDGGWKLSNPYPYEIKAYVDDRSANEAIRLAVESEVMIIGSAPEIYVQKRMASGNKLTFRYSERIYERGRLRAISPRGFILRCETFFRYFGKPLYMLCASSYTAGDLALLGSYLGRCYKWGYFPETILYNRFPNKDTKLILWVGRMIGWKHPEIMVELARQLKDTGIDFRMKMIGNGTLYKSICERIAQLDLNDFVKLTGAISSSQVRKEMEKAGILVATSDYHEGWGAVINEAMNSGCAVVATKSMGSVGFLIKNGKNGISLPYDKNINNRILKAVSELLLDESKQQCLGEAAYSTIVCDWNSRVAAQRLVSLSEKLLNGEKPYFNSGLCSKARTFLL